MISIQKWFILTRLPSTILALTSTALGTMLAIGHGQWNLWVALLAIVTAVLLQVLSNLANDYGDFLHGANVDKRVGGPHQKALINLNQLKQAIGIVALITAIVGLLLLKVTDLTGLAWLKLVFLGILAMTAAIGYTMGPQPYGYLGLGDLAVCLFFGPVGVLGTLYLHTKTWYGLTILPALSCGCLAVAVLNINNIRDQILDQAVGKKTLVVRIGKKAAIMYQWMLLIGSILLLVLFTALHYQSPWQGLFLLAVPLFVKNGWITQQAAPNQLDAILQKLVMNQCLLFLLFGIGFILSNY